jgi:hypothetical protein
MAAYAPHVGPVTLVDQPFFTPENSNMHRRRGDCCREGPRWYDAFENRATGSTRVASKRMLQSAVHGENNTFIEFVLPVGRWPSKLILNPK